MSMHCVKNDPSAAGYNLIVRFLNNFQQAFSWRCWL